MKNKLLTAVLFFLLVLSVTCLSAVLVENRNKASIDKTATEWTGKQKIESEKPEIANIAIPGQTELLFSAGELSQKVNLYNPAENNCNIVFTLSIDGETIWESGECPAGYGFYEIELNRALEPGEYDALLLHECFRENVKLNSANMNIKVKVK